MKAARTICMIAMTLLAASCSREPTTVKSSLDGDWLFRADRTGEGEASRWFDPAHDRSSWARVRLPGFWETFGGMENYDGVGWFARTFAVRDAGKPMSVHFAGVDDDAVVWINGREVGNHTGYSEPFFVNARDALREGENLIVVRVHDHGGGGGIYGPVTFVDSTQLGELMKGPHAGKPARTSAEWVRNASIYCVYLRSFTPEGTFAGLERRLPELKALGTDVIWLMPIHPVGVKNRKGILGSPYSVRDYYAVNPEFGSMADFRTLLDRAHDLDFHVIIDLVANHTSWDCKLVGQHPDWYTRDSSGQIIPPNADWTDVADLNYDNPDLREYMMAMMEWWVRDVGIDGFRCDVAELVPTEFWNDARRRLDAIKPIMLLSEGTLPEHHLEAFDITYSWNIYDILDPLLRGNRSASQLDDLFNNERSQFPIGSLRLRFNTNHDKNAWDAPAIVKFGSTGLPLTAVLIATIPGIPLVYTGEEVANNRALSLFEKVGVDWSRPRNMGSLYHTLLHLRKEHPALSRGAMVRVSANPREHVFAFMRTNDDDSVLVLLNFSDRPVTASITLPDGIGYPGGSFSMKEVLTSTEAPIRIDDQRSLSVPLEGHGYRMFINER